MFNGGIAQELLKAIAEDRERETRRLLEAREARGQRETPAGDGRQWVWHIEPGMEEAFRSLQGWLLSGMDTSQTRPAVGERPA
jgi:hypothetical protein